MMTADIDSPIGTLHAVAEDGVLTGLYLPGQRSPQATGAPDAASDAVLTQTATELAQYFGGTRTSFSVPLRAAGTEFQQRVWGALTDIPFGETRSYADIAVTIDKPTASRAVGAANGKNPISIIVPCHRVIGAGGQLTGYAGGLETKRWLLQHEASV